MKLLGRTENKITKSKNGGSNISSLWYCEQWLSTRVLYTFVPNKSFGQLLEISLTNHIFLKAFKTEFQYIRVWFTDQNNQSLEIEDIIKLIVVIK